MTGSEAVKIVRSVLGQGFTHEQTDQIVKAMVPVRVEPGAQVLREGEKGQGLLVLLEGTVTIVKRGSDGAEVSIATVEAPTVLGEMSLITDQPHSATVRATTACAFQLLTRSQFDRLLKSENLAAYKIVATLAEVMAWRLSRMDDKVVELARRGDCPPPVEELAAFKQKLFSEWNF